MVGYFYLILACIREHLSLFLTMIIFFFCASNLSARLSVICDTVEIASSDEKNQLIADLKYQNIKTINDY